MESSINKQSGGTTAQTPNINPNQQPNSTTKMKNTNDDPITLKQAATEF
jgi:ribosomal protein S30